jgi:hypothetical protein
VATIVDSRVDDRETLVNLAITRAGASGVSWTSKARTTTATP